MQCKWNAWLHCPHAAIQLSAELLMLLGWHSIHGSIKWLRQMAHVSTTISHSQKATAVHFLTSNLGFFFCSISSPGWSSISMLSSFMMMLRNIAVVVTKERRRCRNRLRGSAQLLTMRFKSGKVLHSIQSENFSSFFLQISSFEQLPLLQALWSYRSLDVP